LLVFYRLFLYFRSGGLSLNRFFVPLGTIFGFFVCFRTENGLFNFFGLWLVLFGKFQFEMFLTQDQQVLFFHPTYILGHCTVHFASSNSPLLYLQ
jgi:hypothetical protein